VHYNQREGCVCSLLESIDIQGLTHDNA